MDTTIDSFLGTRIVAEQPKNGYRAATDPVLLAASINAQAKQSILDVGCGVGVAALCLGTRVADLNLVGLEIQPTYAELCAHNAARNEIPMQVEVGDTMAMPGGLRQRVFDHVMSNPPYHHAKTSASPNVAKALADQENVSLAAWIDACLKRVKPRGYFTIIHMAERLPDICAALAHCGDITILPIAPRQNTQANRVIVRARKGSKTPAKLCTPFVMHEGEKHLVDGDSYTKAAKAILRDGAALKF